MASEIKAAARSIIDALPDGATWEDLQYRIYVRQQVDAGLADEAAGRMAGPETVRLRLDQLKRQNRDRRN